MKNAAPAFYQHFDRHAHGKGLKGGTTHYCPGCGHGLAQKYLAEAIAELEIGDRTVAVSPVGCSVFMYYYLDVGNTQAAHGRAPAVALAHKLANPNSIVVSYQGDGDLASIGIAEIMHAANLGVPITVIFANNAIYGMTGGQMAPTTLPGQTSATSPAGRGSPHTYHGFPLKVAELMASLQGTTYVERVALYDVKQRNKAKRAIKKALKMQMAGTGFSFVEVLAECPTHLKMSPLDAEKWVEQEMTKLYPLGLLKDESKTTPAFVQEWPSFEVDDVLAVAEATTQEAPRFARTFPDHLDLHDVALKLAGAGGDGAQTAAMILAKAAINEGFDATHIPSYGPESRGGTSYADVHVARDEVLSPSSNQPHVLLAFNAPSLHKFGPSVRPGGIVIYDSTVVKEVPEFAEGVTVHAVPLSEVAHALGHQVVKNVVALAALVAASNILPRESILQALEESLSHKTNLIPLNHEALAWGFRCIEEGITHLQD